MKKLAFILFFLFSASQVSALILSYSLDDQASLVFSADEEKNYDKGDMKKEVDKHQFPSGQYPIGGAVLGNLISRPPFLYPSFYPDLSTPPPNGC